MFLTRTLQGGSTLCHAVRIEQLMCRADHMLLVEHVEGEGWGKPAIVPFGPLSIHPAATVTRVASYNTAAAAYRPTHSALYHRTVYDHSRARVSQCTRFRLVARPLKPHQCRALTSVAGMLSTDLNASLARAVAALWHGLLRGHEGVCGHGRWPRSPVPARAQHGTPAAIAAAPHARRL